MRQFQASFVTKKSTLRWFHILEHMEQLTYVTVRELSKVVKSSSRTIIEDLQDIKKYFSDCIIMETSNKGYKICILDIECYLTEKRNLIINEPLFKIIESVFLGEILAIDEWCDILFISPATLLRYLQKVEKILGEYNLSINKKKIDIQGEEINIRHFFLHFFYESEVTPYTIFPPKYIYEIVSKLNSSSIINNYYTLTSEETSYILYILLERATQGHYIVLDLNFVKNFREKFYFEINFIKTQLSIFLKKTFLEIEIIYFWALIMSKSIFLDADSAKLFCTRMGNEPLVEFMTEGYLKEVSPPTFSYEYTYALVSSYFSSYTLKHRLSPVLNKELPDLISFAKEKFPEDIENTINCLTMQLEKTKDIIPPIDKQYTLSLEKITPEILENISASLTIQMNSMKELFWKKPKKIAFLLEGNQFISQWTKTTAIKLLGNYHILDFPNAIEATPEYIELHKFDLIVTNYSEYMPDFCSDGTYLLFNPFPNHEDWKRLLLLLELSM